MLIFLPTCQTSDPLLNSLDELDFRNTETPVVEKINSLKQEIRRGKQQDAEAWGRLAINLYLHDFKDHAIPFYRRAAALDSHKFRWPYFCAIALNERSDPQALSWFETARRLNPDYAPMLIRYGEALLVAGKYDQAKTTFQDARRADPRLSHADINLAKIFLNNSALDSAGKYLESGLKKNPRHREAHALLAEVYRRSGQPEAAQEILHKAASLPEKTELPDPLFSKIIDEGVGSFWCRIRGDILMKNGNYARAEQEFRAALKANADAETFTILGLALQKQRKWKEAANCYRTALEHDPAWVEAQSNLSVVLFETGRVEEAISAAQQALQIDSTYADAYLNLGTFWKKAGQPGKAVKIFRRGADLAPQDARFAYQLAWLLATSPAAEIRNGEEALRLSRLVCEKTAFQNPGALDALAAAYAETGQFEQAAEKAQLASHLARKQRRMRLAGEIDQRLKLYQSGNPYRE